MICLGVTIPEYFECARHLIKVEIVDRLESNDFGKWDSVKNTITISKTLKDSDDNIVKLAEMQILNTFMHELIHCFQFYYDNNMPESEAQSFANLMCEYVITKKN